MGCCCCRSKLTVAEDPTISLYTMVGRAAVYHRHGSKLIGKQGLLYVKNEELCHERTVGSKICYKCLKTSWPISELKQITVMDKERLTVAGLKSGQVLFLNPGVKMIFQDPEGNCQTLVVSLPNTSLNYAEGISTQLQHCVDIANDRNS